MDQSLIRNELTALLIGGNAHDGVINKLKAFPVSKINDTMDHIPTPVSKNMTPWHLLEHMRICQEDILDFVINPDYQKRSFPQDYWPGEGQKANPDNWNQSLTLFENDLISMTKMTQDPDVDLTTDLPHAPGYTIFREILVLADHNSYHLGHLGMFEDS